MGKAKKDAVEAVMRDLSCRFFLNLPAEESGALIRLFYQCEQAYWFYEDHLRGAVDTKLPELSFKAFCREMCSQNEFLHPVLFKFDEHFADFKKYLHSVPVCGVIILSPTLKEAILVRGYGSKSWGFPKGKINQGEESIACAIREAREEIGVDVEGLVRERDVIEGDGVRMFVVVGVPRDVELISGCEKEIDDIQWVSLKVIGSDKKLYWGANSFLGPLRGWIKRYRKRTKRSGKNLPESKIEVSSDPDDDFGDILGDFGGWSAHEMFKANSVLGVELTGIRDANELSTSMAQMPSVYRSYGPEQLTPATKKSAKSKPLKKPTAILNKSSKRSQNVAISSKSPVETHSGIGSWSVSDLLELNTMAGIDLPDMPYASKSFNESSEIEFENLIADDGYIFEFDYSSVMDAFNSGLQGN